MLRTLALTLAALTAACCTTKPAPAGSCPEPVTPAEDTPVPTCVAIEGEGDVEYDCR